MTAPAVIGLAIAALAGWALWAIVHGGERIDRGTRGSIRTDDEPSNVRIVRPRDVL